MQNRKVKIIAEAGVNHNGDRELAKRMIYEAKKCGADIIKFQTAKPELVISKFAEKAEYQKRETGSGETQLQMCKRLHLPFADYYLLKKVCEDEGIEFLSTPFDLPSIDFLQELGVNYWKIPSGEITNLPYLEHILKYPKKILLSTGMSSLCEVRQAVAVLTDGGIDEGSITLLHCTTEYPAPLQDVNLRVIETLKREFKGEAGYSDHTAGIAVPIAAAALGATVIEKHFTLDKNMEGPDHKASLEPDELKAMVKAVREVECALGSKEKVPQDSEIKNIQIARKSIVAKQIIKRGEVFSPENITVKRPGTGISPMRYHEITGLTAKRDFEEDELIEL